MSPAYRILVVVRVGAGDSFSGGLIYGLLAGMSTEETVEFTAAASCLKHAIHGDLDLVYRDEVLALVGRDASERI